MNASSFFLIALDKLDKIGLFDIKQTLHQLASPHCPKKEKKKAKHDIWNVICDMWHVTHDMRQVGGVELSLKMSSP